MYKETYDGYDLVGVECRLFNYEANAVMFHELIPKISRIYFDIYLPHSSIPTRLIFSIKPEILHVYGQRNANVDLIGDLDTIERLSLLWRDTHINTESKNIELYLRKTMTEPIEEIKWYEKVNPFMFIIEPKYYDIQPNPQAASTLYTDYNITSSKIITAENITTMRGDLNVVTNNVDVITYDVAKLEQEVDELDERMAIQEIKTQYLEHEVKTIKIMQGVSIAFQTAANLGGLVLGWKGIHFWDNE